MEDAYQSAAARAGLPKLVGLKSDPQQPFRGSMPFFQPILPIKAASHQRLDTIEHTLEAHLQALGLQDIKLATETIDGPAIAATAETSDPGRFANRCRARQPALLVTRSSCFATARPSAACSSRSRPPAALQF